MEEAEEKELAQLFYKNLNTIYEKYKEEFPFIEIEPGIKKSSPSWREFIHMSKDSKWFKNLIWNKEKTF